MIGVLFALALRKLDIPPRKRYVWEDQPEDDVDEEFAFVEDDDGIAPR